MESKYLEILEFEIYNIFQSEKHINFRTGNSGA